MYFTYFLTFWHKDAAVIKYTDKLEQFRAYKPFVKPFLKKRTAPVANPTFVQPKPIIPVQPMVNVISEEEQAEAKPVQLLDQMLLVQNRD